VFIYFYGARLKKRTLTQTVVDFPGYSVYMCISYQRNQIIFFCVTNKTTVSPQVVYMCNVRAFTRYPLEQAWIWNEAWVRFLDNWLIGQGLSSPPPLKNTQGFGGGGFSIIVWGTKKEREKKKLTRVGVDENLLNQDNNLNRETRWRSWERRSRQKTPTFTVAIYCRSRSRCCCFIFAVDSASLLFLISSFLPLAAPSL
jgi:hypothetical protein